MYDPHSSRESVLLKFVVVCGVFATIAFVGHGTVVDAFKIFGVRASSLEESFGALTFDFNVKTSTSLRAIDNDARSGGGCIRNSTRITDVYLLALQLPRAFGYDVDRVTIHGLWPSFSKDPSFYPCNCGNEPLDLDSLSKATIYRMRRNWITLKAGRDVTEFWSHEWEKHGTCFPARDQNEYFTTTLDLRDAYDPGFALSPSPSASLVEVASVYAARHGVSNSLMMGCKHFRDGTQELSEFGVCVSARTKKLAPCSDEMRSTSDEVNSCDLDRPARIVVVHQK